MNKLAAVTVVALSFASASAFAETWSGTISDSMCAAKHVNATKDDIACAQKCVKGGSPAVFVMGDNVYKIENQDAVKNHVGHKVTISGTKSGDTIHIDSVKM